MSQLQASIEPAHGPARSPIEVDGRPLDPVTFQVLQNRVAGIVREMQDNIFRTGYSTIIRESRDASCLILDATGDVVGEQVTLPLHVAALPEVTRAVQRSYGDRICPGDAFITNHPYEAGVTHSLDIAVLTPVFHGDQLIAFCGSIAHKSDLGGMVPGTGTGNARELFQEGIQLPPVRFTHAGNPVPEVEAILRANSRTPDVVVGDVRGQVGTARLGERRLGDLVDRYGLAAVLGTFDEAKRVTEARARRAIASWPDGDFEAESWVDNDGVRLDQPIRYHVRIEKRGEHILFDFRQSADQALGPVNVQPSLVRGCCYYALIAMIDPNLSNNGGLARVVETRFRRGSVLHPIFPAPTNTYMASATAVTEALLQAMNGLVPAKRMAGSGGVGGMIIGGKRDDGSSFVQYELIGSAYGARASKDGVSGVAVLLDNGQSAPIEILESEFPTRVRRFELIVDSGGAGRFRGGLAPLREYEVLASEAQFSLRGGKHTIPPFGLDGGQPGRPGACLLNPGTEAERRLPSRFGGLALKPGDVARIEKAGGGGLGDPTQRPRDQVIADVENGYVSREAAASIYGLPAEQLPEA